MPSGNDPCPLGSFTWVPADSYNYIDIYNGNKARESPARVLESAKLLKQKKVLIDIKKNRRKKKRANHYDELCLQYQYAQDWLNKRNSQVSVSLTKSELKMFIKWFGSRMSLFQKADGIDVDKVSEDFVRHKVFDNTADALAFLAKVDSDGNGALSYEEFCEGVENVHDYLTVMLLKKFIHSLKSKQHEYRTRNSKQQDQYGKLISERMLKKEGPEAPQTQAVTKKAATAGPSLGQGHGDIATAATVIKSTLPGGGTMFTHITSRKRADPAAVLAVPTHSTSHNPHHGHSHSHKENTDGATKKTLSRKASMLSRSNTMMSVGGQGRANSIRKNSIFLAPETDPILTGHDILFETHIDEEMLEEPSAHSDSSTKYALHKNKEQDIEAINRKMQKKLSNFIQYRQMSFEEKENMKGDDGGDGFSTVLNDDSIVLEEAEESQELVPPSPKGRRTVAWGDSRAPRSRRSPSPEKRSPAASPGKPSGFKNKLMGAIARNSDKMKSS
mmetsp:Transcript_18911/g.31568  ORF Transcript_18911/g.31568 Transcript_18911/m.31568 type:complete len:501 (-) Transcript_18911:307-1809(-)